LAPSWNVDDIQRIRGPRRMVCQVRLRSCRNIPLSSSDHGLQLRVYQRWRAAPEGSLSISGVIMTLLPFL
jgi:hypothetical protein